MSHFTEKTLFNKKSHRLHVKIPRIRRRGSPGSSPESLSADAESVPSKFGYTRYNSESFAEELDSGIDRLPSSVEAGEVLWIDVAGVGDVALIDELGKRFGLHGLAIEDVVNTHQRPKAEEYGDHLYIVARVPLSEHSGETQQVSIFLSKGVVLTLQERNGDCFAPLRERLRQGRKRIRGMAADYLVYALLDVIVDKYFPTLEGIGEALEELETEIVSNPNPACIEQLHGLKHTLLSLRRAVWPTRDMLTMLIRDESPYVAESTDVYLRDVHDHTFQLVDIIETYREIASDLMDVYLSSQSTKLNEVMKMLTIIATVFLPITFVAGVYGMNFDRSSPWNMPELGWRFGYLFALGLMTALVAGMVYYFWRKGWMRK